MARNPAIPANVRRVDVAPNMAVEVATYPQAHSSFINLRMLQMRMGNRVLWTWAILTPAKARAIAAQLVAAASELEGSDEKCSEPDCGNLADPRWFIHVNGRPMPACDGHGCASGEPCSECRVAADDKERA